MVNVTSAELRDRMAKNPAWYHTMDLAQGVATPGYVDWRKKAASILPSDLSGKRCLDIGTYDGFWAFEMEKRGGEVVAIDLDHLTSTDWPPINRARLEREQAQRGTELGIGFTIAAEARASSVNRVICSVYDLTPEAVGGPIDFAFLGALLLHLREPARALEAIATTLRPGGTLKVLECVSIRDTIRAPRTPLAAFEPLTHDFNWWRPNAAGLMAYLRAAGFADVRRGRFHRPPARKEMRTWYLEAECSAPQS
jgi:SAM-dependent methyltransferase